MNYSNRILTGTEMPQLERLISDLNVESQSNTSLDLSATDFIPGESGLLFWWIET